MRAAITGSSGFIGSALLSELALAGHQVVRVVRREARGPDAIRWDPETGTIEAEKLEGLDAVIHLAGESIVGRWTPSKKAGIQDSRRRGTRLLAETLASLARRPRVLIAASAIGYYGDRGDERLTEQSPPGTGFLPDVCREWEQAAQPVTSAGIRLVHLRIGVVLSPRGGALAKMLPPFRLGLGGILGTGRQHWSWVALGDVTGAIQHALITDSVRGPVNVVSPNPATNAEFTRALGRVLRRPTIFPVPAFAARLLMGEMADALLLASARVEPTRLVESGYRFRYPELDAALRHLLGR